MPYRKKYGKRKPTKKRRRNNYRQRNMTKFGVPSGIPTQRRAYLRYCDVIEIPSNNGVLAGHIFRANSIYDPDETGIGHQPMGFDQWTGLFRHYCVVGAKISIQVKNNSGSISSEQPSTVGVYLSDNNSVEYTTANGFIEAKRGQFRNIQYHKQARMTTNFSAKKFFNITDIKDNETRLGASITTNPSEMAYFVIWNQADGTGTTNIAFRVVIDYIVDFMEPKTISQS